MIERKTYRDLKDIESKLIVRSVFQKKKNTPELEKFRTKVWLSEESVKSSRENAYDIALNEALRITRLPGRTGLTWSDVERILAIASQKDLCLGEKK